MSKENPTEGDGIKPEEAEKIVELVNKARFENAVEAFDMEAIKIADQAVRKYGSEAVANNEDMPDRMIGWIKLMYKIKEE